MNDINLGNMQIPVIKPQKGVDYYTETEKQELIQETTAKVNQIIEPKETERQANEQIRKLNEEDRKAKESTRISNETERQSNEGTRQNNENERQSNEIIRQTNEQGRVEAEQSRNTFFNNQMTENEKAIQNIKDKTTEYNANAETKTNEFNSNAGQKTQTFNENVEQKTQTFNENANAKLQEINQIKDITEAKIAEINEKDEAQDTEISNIKSKNTEQDRTIQDNAESIEELKAENERLREDLNNTVPSVSGEGENVTLKDTANARFKKFGISGNSWQETRSGKNKINVPENYTFTGIQTITSLLDLTPNTEYIITCKNVIKGGNNAPQLRIGSTYYTLNDNTKITFTTADSILASYIYSNGASASDSEGVTSTINKLMIRLLNEDDTYEPYGAMPSTEFPSDIRNCGDNVNLFDKKSDKINAKIYDASGNQTSGENDDFCLNDYIKVESSTTYTINGSTYIRLCEYDDNKTFISRSATSANNASITFTTNSNTKYIRFSALLSCLDKIQLIKGTTPKPYSPYNCGNANVKITNGLEDTDTNYQEQSFTFPLAEGQKLMLGDYLADDGIHHIKGQIIFDGTNYSFSMTERNDGNKAFWISNTNIPNAKLSSNIKMSNYFKYEYISWQKASVPSMSENNIGDVDPMFLFNVPTDFASSVSEWNNRLIEWNNAGNPLVVEYELAEEEIDPYTEEQQAVYDEIKKTAHSYRDTTHIFCTDETSLIFNVEAKADIQAMFNNLQAQILAEGV